MHRTNKDSRIWIKLLLLSTACLLVWVGMIHYLFDVDWSKAIGLGILFTPFFFGFLGVAFFLPRMME